MMRRALALCRAWWAARFADDVSSARILRELALLRYDGRRPAHWPARLPRRVRVVREPRAVIVANGERKRWADLRFVAEVRLPLAWGADTEPPRARP